MAEPAEELPGDESGQPASIVQMPGTDSLVSLKKTAEGGLTLHFALDIPRLPNLRAVPTWTHRQMFDAALVLAVTLIALFLVYQQLFAGSGEPPVGAAAGPLRANVATDFNPTVETPAVADGSYVDRLASVIGDVHLGKDVFVAPFASIRGDEGQPIFVGEGSNVQDMVVLHALETFEKGKLIENNLVTVDGKKYAVYVGSGVSLAHQSQVHGPAAVGDHTFVGMQSLIFKATVGKNVVIEPGAKLIGVNVPEGRYVPAGSVITTQAAADALPRITDDYPFAKLNEGVLHVNESFADAYLKLARGGSPAASGH